MSQAAPDPSGFLPLTATVFEILLSLVDGERHGYAIMRDVELRSDDKVKLRPGSLYRAVHRLMEQGLLAEAAERPDPERDDERRRYYRLTSLGRAVARAEAERYAAVLSRADGKGLVGRREST